MAMSLTNIKIHIAYSVCFSSRWFASHADWNLAICPSMRNVAFGLINGLRQHICSQDRKNTHCPSLSETPRGWKLLRVSEQRLIKRFGKSCPNFQLTLHLKYAYLPTCINCLPTPGYHKICISYVLSTVSPTKMQWVLTICSVIENCPAAYLWDFLYLNGRKHKFCDYGELINRILLVWPSLNPIRARI